MIVMYAPWFGQLPICKNLFLASCKQSYNCLFIVHSDQLAPQELPENVIWVMEFSLSSRVQRLFPNIKLRHRLWHHKLCDLKPFWHVLFHETWIPDTYYRGWVDWDCVFNFSKFIPKHRAIVFTLDWMCGPCFIQRNEDSLSWPINLPFLLNMDRTSAWDESYYIPNLQPVAVQIGMNPEMDVPDNYKIPYVMHLHKAKDTLWLAKSWIKQYCNFEVTP